MPEPDCDNDAQGVLIVVERNSGDLVLERLICQPCVEREIRGWMGGGTLTFDGPLNPDKGLSPRGRGNLEPMAGVWRPDKVYPRVGGGTQLPAQLPN